MLVMSSGVRVCLAGVSVLVTLLAQGPPAASVANIQQLIRNGSFAQARTELDSALQQYPSSAGLHNLSGVVAAQSGNYRLAETSFQKAILLDRRMTSAYLNLGRLYQENAGLDKGAVRKGAQIYLDLLKVEPENPEAQYQAAYMLLLDRSYQTSLTLLARLPAEVQRKAQVLALRCADETGLGRIAQASATAKELLSSPDVTEADVQVVQPVLAAGKQLKLETTLLEGLAARRLASRDSLVRLAALYEAGGQLPEARATLETVAAAGPVTVPLLTSMAQVAYRQHDLKGALGYLAHARDLDRANGAVHFFFGMVCVEMDLPVEAERSLTEAVRLNPENAYWNYALGAVTVQARKWEAAIPYLQKYAKLRPQDPRGELVLAMAHFHSHQDDIARKLLQEIVGNAQTAAGAHLYLGKLALRENDFGAAEMEFRRSVEANPDNAEAHAELGFVYVQLERYAQARESLARSLKLQPDGVRANMTLLTLYQRTDDQRAAEQAKHVKEVIKKRDEESKALLRTIEVRPY